MQVGIHFKKMSLMIDIGLRVFMFSSLSRRPEEQALTDSRISLDLQATMPGVV